MAKAIQGKRVIDIRAMKRSPLVPRKDIETFIKSKSEWPRYLIRNK